MGSIVPGAPLIVPHRIRPDIERRLGEPGWNGPDKGL
jgi:hypothetical protein